MAQFPIAEAAIEALGIRLWPMVPFEADDAIATAVSRWADDPAVEQVVICSPDKDMAQCVRADRVVLLDRRRRIVYDEDGVDREMGRPAAVDPGPAGPRRRRGRRLPRAAGLGREVGRRGPAPRYGSLEAIPAQASDWDVPVRGAVSLAATLRDRRDEVFLYRTLARLRTDAPVGESVGRRAALAGSAAGPLAGVLRRDRAGSAPLAAPSLARRRLTRDVGRGRRRVSPVASRRDDDARRGSRAAEPVAAPESGRARTARAAARGGPAAPRRCRTSGCARSRSNHGPPDVSVTVAPARSTMSPAAATSQADSPWVWAKASNRPAPT